MIDNRPIRRALADSGMELPADQPVPSRLIDDIYAATDAAPAPVVGRKYKLAGERPHAGMRWLWDGANVRIADKGGESERYYTLSRFTSAIASGELVPADDEPATMTDAEAFESFPAGKGEWSDAAYPHTEIEGAMPECPFCNGCHAANDCPTHGKPLSDPASKAIAAHTTPGKGEPASIDIEAAIAEQAMRRLATRLATEWACDTVSIRIANGTTYAWVSAWVGTALCEENGSTLAEAMTKCKEKLTASRCTCPACGRGGV